jgi:hypothetical protein
MKCNFWKPATLISVVLLLLMPGCAASQTDRVDASDEIVTLETQMWEDWKNKKYDAMKTRMAEDALIVISDGIVDRNRFVEEMRAAACEGSTTFNAHSNSCIGRLSVQNCWHMSRRTILRRG